jgi:putative component of membrane protein insertase Oxa1/YidC/SpoIIIJ protein YidD
MTALAAATFNNLYNQPYQAGHSSASKITAFNKTHQCTYFGCCGHGASSTSKDTVQLAGTATNQPKHITLNPNKFSLMLPELVLGKQFDVFAPLVAGQELNGWQKLFLSPIALYQALTRRNETKTGPMMRMISDGCKFTQEDRKNSLSCSEYMATAIKFFGQTGVLGVLKAVWLGVKRIFACNPWNQTLTDPEWQIKLPAAQAKLWQSTGVDVTA